MQKYNEYNTFVSKVSKLECDFFCCITIDVLDVSSISVLKQVEVSTSNYFIYCWVV